MNFFRLLFLQPILLMYLLFLKDIFFYTKSLQWLFVKLCISQLLILVVPALCSSFCYAHKKTHEEIDHCFLSTVILLSHRSVQFERFRGCYFWWCYNIHYLKYIFCLNYAFSLCFRFWRIPFLFVVCVCIYLNFS